MIRVDVRQIAAALGGEAHGNQVSAPGPGHSPKDRSLSILVKPDAPGGFVVQTFSGRDDWRTCRDYVCKRLGFVCENPRPPHQRPLVIIEQSDVDRRLQRQRLASEIWQQSTAPAGTVVEAYLRDHRGLELLKSDEGRVIRYNGALFFDRDIRLPGMVCLLRDINTNTPVGIHRTFLDPHSAAKVDRRMLGTAKGAAIKLDDLAGNVLTIGEGIETVLSARAAGYGPAWALGSAGSIGSFPLIPTVREIVALQENDDASRRQVRLCSKRYLAARRPVTIITSNVGNDFNDAWKAMR